MSGTNDVMQSSLPPPAMAASSFVAGPTANGVYRDAATFDAWRTQTVYLRPNWF